jgi:methionyl-tRNA formyltransferase
MRIVFMGTPDFAVPTLQALIDSAQHEVVAVYSQPPRPSGRGHKVTPSAVHQLADKHGIAVHTPKTLKDAVLQAQFRCHSADIAVVAAYGLLLPDVILQTYPKGCINVHPSELPRWRGAAPIQRTIMAGDTSTAMCIMQMGSGLDTGDVLLREAYAISPDMTAGALHDAMAAKGAECILRVLEEYDTITPEPQQGAATYAKKISKEEAMIDWSRPADDIINHIRGLNPYPAARTDIGGEVVKIFAAVPTDANTPLGFTCGDGKTLAISELQRAGKKRMSAVEALRGWDL